MKTMNLTPMASAMYESKEATSKLMNTAKKIFASTVRFFIVISPVYPMYVESLKKKNEA